MDEAYARVKMRLARSLSQVPVMIRDRDDVVAELRDYGFSLSAGPGSTLMMVCMRIVDWALQERGAFPKLIDLLLLLDPSEPTKRFKREVDALPPSDIYSFRERMEFIEKLKPLIPETELKSYYQIVAGYQAPAGDSRPGILRSVGDLVSEIEQLVRRGPVHPLIMLTEAVAQRGDPDAAEIARSLGDGLAQNLDEVYPRGKEQDSLNDLRQPGAPRLEEPVRTADRATLVLQLEPSGQQRDLYLFSASLYLGTGLIDKMCDRDEPVALDKVRADVNEARYGEDVLKVDLEFVLPRALLCQPIEEWSTWDTYQQLQRQFVVVVRDLERQQNRSLRLMWRRKWKHMVDNDTGPGAIMPRWITCGDPQRERGQLYGELTPDACFAVGLTFPPEPGIPGFRFDEVLNAGAPITIWPRQRCDHGGAAWRQEDGPCTGILFQKDFQDRLAGVRFKDLPQLVLELRRQAADESGRRLTLLWDDPGRSPRPPGRSLGPPREES
jgi:vWA-MoxR associated protein C-terminal domain